MNWYNTAPSYVAFLLLSFLANQSAWAGPPVNDDCQDAIAIGDGLTLFSTIGATTDGLPHSNCQYSGQTVHDIWFVYTASCDGELVVTTCEELGGSADYDTDIVIYDSTTCPATSTNVLSCDDDDVDNPCGTAAGGYHSTTRALVSMGAQYLIRVGGYDDEGVDFGSGELNISCQPLAVCTTAVSCQTAVGGALTSDANSSFLVAENFRSPTGGTIEDVCWWGIYIDFPSTDCAPGPGNSFRITYYYDNAGVPGSLKDGPFLVTATSAPAGTNIGYAEFAYTASHAPVSITPYECYWIEIVDINSDPECLWLWSLSQQGDQNCYQTSIGSRPYDLAICLDIPLLTYGCNDVEGACCVGGTYCLDGIDETTCLNIGGAFNGLGTNCFDSPCPPANDDCEDAVQLAVPSTTTGYTTGGTIPSNVPASCPPAVGPPVFVTAPGVWYRIIGTGNTITATTCSSYTNYDTQITVYCGCCDSLNCVAANDDDSGALPACDLNGLNRKSTVNFCSELGTPYYVLVHGYNGFTGHFELIVTDNSTPCANPVSCVRPSLALVADDTCSDGNQIVVDILLSDLCTEGVGGQFFLEYDDSVLSLNSIDPGDAPFTLEVYENTSTAGVIDYATGVVGGGTGATAGVMARATFDVIGEVCQGDDLVAFRPHSPPTRVTNNVGTELLPMDLVSIQPITIDVTAPSLTIPADISVHADAGLCTADVNPGSASATDNCDTSVTIVAARDDLLPLNDPFDVGLTTIEWTATDDCGNETIMYQTVTVSGNNEAIIDLAYDGPLSNAVTRCIEFIFSGNDGPETVTQVVNFSAGGTATGVSVLVPCGDYDCLTVRDPLHSLASSVDLNISGTQYIASAVGPDAMIGGNLNGDLFIDVLDFGVFIGQYAATLPANTNCSTPAPHADITGNGNVGSDDFSFIQINFLKGSDTGCTALVFAGNDNNQHAALLNKRPVKPIRAITVTDLRRRGLGDLAVADLNGDQWLDERDIAAFLQGARP